MQENYSNLAPKTQLKPTNWPESVAISPADPTQILSDKIYKHCKNSDVQPIRFPFTGARSAKMLFTL